VIDCDVEGGGAADHPGKILGGEFLEAARSSQAVRPLLNQSWQSGRSSRSEARLLSDNPVSYGVNLTDAANCLMALPA
jgi:hypothetical protein